MLGEGILSCANRYDVACLPHACLCVCKHKDAQGWDWGYGLMAMCSGYCSCRPEAQLSGEQPPVFWEVIWSQAAGAHEKMFW